MNRVFPFHEVTKHRHLDEKGKYLNRSYVGKGMEKITKFSLSLPAYCL
jgi:hypothetical protein